MACTQQVKSSQVTQLLPNEVVTEQQSLIFVKKLLAIAVSGITYLRGIFPKRAYGTKYVEDEQVMILKGERDCPASSRILQWMQGCFDAVQKKYLRTVIISIYTDPENPKLVTEFYQFKIQYTTKGTQLDFESSNTIQKVSTESCGSIKKASILLVRKLYTLMQNLGPLPDNVCLNMKLAYYDDVTPPDYQPPGFKEAEGDTMDLEQEPVRLTMGEVATPFHCIKFDMATEKRRLEQVEEISSVKEKWVVKIEDQGFVQSRVPEDVEKPDNQNRDVDNTEIQMSISERNETCVEAAETDNLVGNNSDLELRLKRTRSGRIIKSSTVSKYNIHCSQESSTASAIWKRRKFSEPKDHC
uniref:HORMA domain containing 1 n=1 Tax=Nothobranchius furzeri TaxID=105023 RepID=A0A1A8B5W6_NOTFU